MIGCPERRLSMAASTSSLIRLLAIDDEPESLELIEDALTQPNLEVLTAPSPEEGWDLVRRKHPEIVLLDLMMPRIGGLELLEKIVEFDPGIDVVLLTGHYSTESAVEAIRKGACDYLTKPFSPVLLRERIEKLLMDARKRHHALELEGELLEACRFQNMVGRSPQMLEVFSRIRRVAPHYRIALVTGATGTGKELVAQALHQLSPVASKTFAVCNCSAVVETLFESELFGYVKGAFTGATQDHSGLFEYASGGTVFLDEIGDMPLATQSKLLRVLQNQEIQRVGSPAVRKVDVRVVAATNQDLKTMIAAKQFREDLYYRLSMVELKLPRLADRKEDLSLLQQHFLERFARQYNKPVRTLSQRAQALLCCYSWPGNIRELENVLGNACMMAQGDTIDVRDLPEPLREQAPQAGANEESPLTIAEVEHHHACRVLEWMGGNKVRTARALGISRATLYSILGEDNRDRHENVPQAALKSASA
jgi:DNA-binding NtrC family response regulator